MEYRTNNFGLSLPDGWHDQTIYAFTAKPAGQPGVSLVITKEPLIADKDVSAFKEIMMARLPAELGETEILNEWTDGLHPKIKMLHLEMKWKSPQYGLLHNHIGAFAAPALNSNNKALEGFVFTLNCLESLYKKEYKEVFTQILSSVQF